MNKQKLALIFSTVGVTAAIVMSFFIIHSGKDPIIAAAFLMVNSMILPGNIKRLFNGN